MKLGTLQIWERYSRKREHLLQALREECVWDVQGITRRLVQLGKSEGCRECRCQRGNMSQGLGGHCEDWLLLWVTWEVGGGFELICDVIWLILWTLWWGIEANKEVRKPSQWSSQELIETEQTRGCQTRGGLGGRGGRMRNNCLMWLEFPFRVLKIF